MSITRRNFLKGAAIGGVGVASAGLLAGCASQASGSGDASRVEEGQPAKVKEMFFDYFL